MDDLEKAAEKYWRKLGPGLTTGAADDDPSGIATYSQAGALFGLQVAWLAAWTFPLMSVVQEMCARIGLVTGHGLASNIRRHYSRYALYFCTFLLFAANTFNIGADLGAMSASVKLLFPQANYFLLILFFAALSLSLQIFIKYAKYAKYLKYLTFSLLAYVFVAFAVQNDWGEIFSRAFVPSIQFSREYLFIICAVLGTTISPYLFFWETSQEVEEKNIATHPRTIKTMRTDVWSGMFFSNLVMFFIIVATASTLFKNGISIQTAADAASALKPFTGSFASALFALGVVGTGLLAIPVLAGSVSYAFSEKKSHAFRVVLILSVVLGVLIHFLGISPIKALLYAAVLNGLIAPVMLFFILRIGGRGDIMGRHKNGPWSSLLGWGLFAIMAGVGIALIM